MRLLPNYRCCLRLDCDTLLLLLLILLLLLYYTTTSTTTAAALYCLHTGLAVLHPMKLTVHEVIPEGE